MWWKQIWKQSIIASEDNTGEEKWETSDDMSDRAQVYGRQEETNWETGVDEEKRVDGSDYA